MSFRLVPKSVTLNDLERRNVIRKSSRSLSHLLMSSCQMLGVASLLLCNFFINSERSADNDTVLSRERCNMT